MGSRDSGEPWQREYGTPTRELPPPKDPRAPVPPGLPVEGQTTADQRELWIWLPLPETRRFGRRSPTPASAEALTTTTPSRRGGALARRHTKRT